MRGFDIGIFLPEDFIRGVQLRIQRQRLATGRACCRNPAARATPAHVFGNPALVLRNCQRCGRSVGGWARARYLQALFESRGGPQAEWILTGSASIRPSIVNRMQGYSKV